MSMPFYASAEQIMRDRSEYARKGIARGRSVIVLTYADGVLFVAENTSSALHKVSEIYDRIGFAAVGKYNEFENLRVAGIRLADLRGYSYDRRDVTARRWPTPTPRPWGRSSPSSRSPTRSSCASPRSVRRRADQLYRLSYDGTIVDEPDFLVMGGQADTVANALKQSSGPTCRWPRRCRSRSRCSARSVARAARAGCWWPTASRSRCWTATGPPQVPPDHRPRADQLAARPRRRPPAADGRRRARSERPAAAQPETGARTLSSPKPARSRPARNLPARKPPSPHRQPEPTQPEPPQNG